MNDPLDDLAARVSKNPELQVGFDPASIAAMLAIIKSIMDYVKGCKPKTFASRDQLIADCGKECKRLREQNEEICPRKVRAFVRKEHRIRDKEQQDRLWFATVTGAANDLDAFGLF